MPRFFFNVRDHIDVDDVDGIELVDLHDARVHAVRMLGGWLDSNPTSIVNSGNYRIEVTDETPCTVFILHILAVDVAATSRKADAILRAGG